MSDPTPAQIQAATTNLQNMQDWVNHLHGYLQDIIQEVYDKLSEDADYDPLQKFVTNMLDSTLWSIGSIPFPGSGVVSSFLGTFFGSYSGPNPPTSLQGNFGSVWERFDATFLQANSDLADLHAKVAADWDNTFTNPVTGKTVSVSDLGTGAVSMPGKYDPDYQTMTDAAVAAYKVSLTKQTIGVKWFVLQDPTGVFEKESEQDVIAWIHMFVGMHPAYMVTYHKDTGGTVCPEKGYMILENYLGTGSGDYYTAGSAPADLCNWLFQDDGYGTVTNKNGIATRKDVFYNWGLRNSLTATSATAVDYADAVDEATRAERAKAAQWHALFGRTPRQMVERAIILKSQEDPDFRRRLVRDSGATLSEFLGVPFPEGVEVEVIQETPGKFKMVLPLIGGPEAGPSEDI